MVTKVPPAQVDLVVSVWESIFLSTDPFGWPFRDSFTRGKVFFPTDGCQLRRDQYLALTAAIAETGENGFYLSVVESRGGVRQSIDHWNVDADSFQDYSKLNLTLENALYSKTGTWGIMLSHEMHAVIAGTDRFLAAITKEYPSWKSDISQLRGYWADNDNRSWLTVLERHLS